MAPLMAPLMAVDGPNLHVSNTVDDGGPLCVEHSCHAKLPSISGPSVAVPVCFSLPQALVIITTGAATGHPPPHPFQPLARGSAILLALQQLC